MSSPVRKAAITGGRGLLGSHMAIYLAGLSDTFSEIVIVNRDCFSDASALNEKLRGVETIFHFAARIVGPDDVVIDENRELNRSLLEALNIIDAKPHIVYSSSINENRNDAYGRSKRESDQLLKQWCTENSCNYTRMVLPHVFGEGGKENHNSVISTFCAQVSSGEVPQIINDGDLEILHAQRAVEQIYNQFIEQSENIEVKRLVGTQMKVSELARRLQVFHESYKQSIIPDISDIVDLDLFNTYRSYFYKHTDKFAPFIHEDNRGKLTEIVKEKSGGQIFYSTSKPGVIRGQHYHRFKVERFVVISGEAEINLRKVNSEDVKTISVSGDNPICVDIPTLHVHNIENTGDTDLITLFWVNEIFDPENPDTYPEIL